MIDPILVRRHTEQMQDIARSLAAIGGCLADIKDEQRRQGDALNNGVQSYVGALGEQVEGAIARAGDAIATALRPPDVDVDVDGWSARDEDERGTIALPRAAVLGLARALAAFPWSSDSDPIPGADLVDALNGGTTLRFLAAVARLGEELPDDWLSTGERVPDAE